MSETKEKAVVSNFKDAAKIAVRSITDGLERGDIRDAIVEEVFDRVQYWDITVSFIRENEHIPSVGGIQLSSPKRQYRVVRVVKSTGDVASIVIGDISKNANNTTSL